MPLSPERLPAGLDKHGLAYWKLLDSRFSDTCEHFPQIYKNAIKSLNSRQLDDWIEYGNRLGKLGLGSSAQIEFLRSWPQVVELIGDKVLDALKQTVETIWKTPNKPAIAKLMQKLPGIAGALVDQSQRQKRFKRWLNNLEELAAQTSLSVHGHHPTHASHALIPFIEYSHLVLNVLDPGGVDQWLDYGMQLHRTRPDHLAEYCALKSPESIALLAKVRPGCTLEKCRPVLAMLTKALTDQDPDFIAIPTHDLDRHNSHLAKPYMEGDELRLPDIYAEKNSISPVQRYLMAVLHMLGHKAYSQPLIADNLSPLQRLAVETLEDARIDYLLVRRWPGMLKVLVALHPLPDAQALENCTDQSLVRLRLAVLSRAILDADFHSQDAAITKTAQAFRTVMDNAQGSTADMQQLAFEFVAVTRSQQDQLATVWFNDTRVDYHDDNRHLWLFIEAGDEEELFEQQQTSHVQQHDTLPPCIYDEWDYQTQTYRPQWVSLFEHLQPGANSGAINSMLEQNRDLLNALARVLEKFRPHDRQRLRFQEDGDEIDMDIAVQSWINLQIGITPDARIDQSIQHRERQLAIYILLDLSQSLNQSVNATQTRLQLCQQAVAVLAWVMNQLGDRFAIGGFCSNTRHNVNFQHIKGYGEQFNDQIKARLASLEPAYSTRMGVALRHASGILRKQSANQKLLLLLTDGEPADVDVADEDYLIEDSRQAVHEARQLGILPYCISTDIHADDYARRIFSHRVAVIDHVEKLPQKTDQHFFTADSLSQFPVYCPSSLPVFCLASSFRIFLSYHC